MNNKPTRPIIIFSVEGERLSKELNSDFTNDVETYMNKKDISYNKCIGSYKGQLEYSFVVTEKAFQEHLRESVFNVHDQESVLHVDEEENTHLLFSDGNIKRLGKLEKTSIQNAIDNEEAFTIHGNRAYIVK